MRLWRVVVLLNLALGAGLFLGYLTWGRPADGLVAEQAVTQRPLAAPGIEQVFSARGVVRGVIPELGVVVLTHEDIPGFMAAMTMGFPVADAGIVSGLEAGDVVRFVLRGVPPKMTITAAEREGRG